MCDRLMFLVMELLPILGVATNTALHITYREIEEQSSKFLKENNINNNSSKTVTPADSTQMELMKIFQDVCFHLRKDDRDSAVRAVRELSKLSTENFNLLKNLGQRIFLAKFMIFSLASSVALLYFLNFFLRTF